MGGDAALASLWMDWGLRNSPDFLGKPTKALAELSLNPTIHPPAPGASFGLREALCTLTLLPPAPFPNEPLWRSGTSLAKPLLSGVHRNISSLIKS